MPRFVLLRHVCPPGYVKPSHWDFMLEFGGVLRTWELRELPAQWRGISADSQQVILATRLEDHRIEYLNYQGPLTGERGSVSREANGEFKILEDSDAMLAVQLESEMYSGVLRLTAASDQGHWQLQLLD